jgi:hypothetical protein
MKKKTGIPSIQLNQSFISTGRQLYERNKTMPNRVYISGPITGRPDGNIEAFCDAALDILTAGNYPVNPHDVGYLLSPGSSWLDYMRVDIKALVDCDEIYMLRGWWRSRGARLEWVIAQGLGMKVRYEKR